MNALFVCAVSLVVCVLVAVFAPLLIAWSAGPPDEHRD